MEYRVKVGEEIHVVDASDLDSSLANPVKVGEKTMDVAAASVSPEHLHLRVDGRPMNVYVAAAQDGIWVWADGRARLAQDADQVVRRRSRGPGGAAPSAVTPPTPATVVRLLTEVGQSVTKGTPLVVVSAMKMEITLSAPFDGVVTAVNTEEGAAVSPGEILVDIAKQPEEEADE
jgi:3-methylcrotonyl-CoA carboxylase alpha subunit